MCSWGLFVIFPLSYFLMGPRYKILIIIKKRKSKFSRDDDLRKNVHNSGHLMKNVIYSTDICFIFFFFRRYPILLNLVWQIDPQVIVSFLCLFLVLLLIWLLNKKIKSGLIFAYLGSLHESTSVNLFHDTFLLIAVVVTLTSMEYYSDNDFFCAHL